MVQRKPTLPILRPDRFLPRDAARKFVGLMLYHEPPRTTRQLPEAGPFGLREGAFW